MAPALRAVRGLLFSLGGGKVLLRAGGARLERCCGGAWFSYERLHAPVRGLNRFFIKANVLFCVPKENQKSTSDFDALDPRERGCSPLSDPKGEVETEKS